MTQQSKTRYPSRMAWRPTLLPPIIITKGSLIIEQSDVLFYTPAAIPALLYSVSHVGFIGLSGNVEELDAWNAGV